MEAGGAKVEIGNQIKIEIRKVPKIGGGFDIIEKEMVCEVIGMGYKEGQLTQLHCKITREREKDKEWKDVSVYAKD